jgi:hypothetical protein
MTSLRRLASTLAPFLLCGACAQLIGLSDYEKGEVTDGDGGDSGEGGESGAGGTRGGNGGTSGNQSGGSVGRGGSRTGGEGGMGGESSGGDGGDAGEMGTGGDPTGGRGGMGGQGGAAGGGMGAAAGAGGSGGGTNCSTVPMPLVGANFDQDTSAWITYSEGSALPIIVAGQSLGITAETPPNIAHLGGVDYVYAGQFQPITIPMGAVTLTLTGYRQADTEEDPGSDVYDVGAIQMYEDALDPSSTLVGQFVDFTNQDVTNGWVQFTGNVAVSGYAGQTVDFDMWSELDTSNVTNFYVDSLVLTALVCQ